MDVTIDNFDEIYPQIQSLLKIAFYISFDEEMTGIQGSGDGRNRKDDDPEIRYQKIVPIANKFSIVQFGLSIFIEEISNTNNQQTKALKAYPFNFYLFPTYGKDIIMSTSSIDFLKKNKMDFNTWITKGVTYTDEEGDTWAYKKYLEPLLHSSNENNDSNNDGNSSKKSRIVLTKPSDIDFITRNFEKLNIYIQQQNVTSSQAIPFEFEPCNSYLRRVIYESVAEDYPQINLSQSKTTSGVLLATLTSTSDKKELQRIKLVEARTKYEQNIGFRRVFKDIKDAKVPIVGHNCLFDLMFLSRACIGPFPETFEEYKVLLSSYFPVIFDTKYLASSGCLGCTIQDTTLSEVYSYYHNANNLTHKIDIKVSEDLVSEEKLHNAGYDAYITGYIFAQQIYQYSHTVIFDYSILSSVTGIESQESARESIESKKESILRKVLTYHLVPLAGNKLFMMQSIYHMDLTPDQPHGIVKTKGTLLYLTCPKTASNNDLIDIFDKAGIDRNRLDLLWIDATSLIIELQLFSMSQTIVNSSANTSASASASGSFNEGGKVDIVDNSTILSLIQSCLPSVEYTIEDYWTYKTSLKSVSILNNKNHDLEDVNKVRTNENNRTEVTKLSNMMGYIQPLWKSFRMLFISSPKDDSNQESVSSKRVREEDVDINGTNKAKIARKS